MKKKNKLLLILLTLICFVFSAGLYVYATGTTYSTCTIVFSNISSSGGSVTGGPGTSSTKTSIGLVTPDQKVLVQLADLSYMGLTTHIYNESRYEISANGQTIVFNEDSNHFTSTISYGITVPGSSQTSYSFSLNGDASTPAIEHYGIAYVPLKEAAMQAGATFYKYDQSSNTATIYDFKVNGDSSYSDPSKYVVGGKWLNNWTGSTSGAVKVAPHFKRNELWYKSGNYVNGDYGYHLKIAVDMLQAEENIRYYYNNQQSLNVTDGFRTFVDNITTSGAGKRSMHMRGRAIDTTSSYGTQTLYNNIYNEFKGSNTTPISYNSIIWRSRVEGTAADKSKAYEMEKMPHNNSWWVHLGVAPKADCGY